VYLPRNDEVRMVSVRAVLCKANAKVEPTRCAATESRVGKFQLGQHGNDLCAEGAGFSVPDVAPTFVDTGVPSPVADTGATGSSDTGVPTEGGRGGPGGWSQLACE
jgi:hypothetical protein